ncbi:MAG: 50S ribosomal protein L22 [Thaumarchaeota archaeon]|nr:50S ribosomal protein L22 [Candidatus Calditenuaceae archaeon]MDW8042539.1 50S ribosomal protein L22 [Nitrososphaerota archaeon]
MPTWGYSVQDLDESRTVKASLREVDASPKWTRELCAAIKGMNLEDAKKLLEDVIAKRRMIPYRRYRKLRAHHSETKGPGGYPVKPAKLLLKLLESLEANADFKGLDTARLRIVHAAAHRGRVLERFFPRAFGRASPHNRTLIHVEVIAEQY